MHERDALSIKCPFPSLLSLILFLLAHSPSHFDDFFLFFPIESSLRHLGRVEYINSSIISRKMRQGLDLFRVGCWFYIYFFSLLRFFFAMAISSRHPSNLSRYFLEAIIVVSFSYPNKKKHENSNIQQSNAILQYNFF